MRFAKAFLSGRHLPLLRLAGWSTVGVIVGSSVLSVIYDLLVVPPGPPIRFTEVLVWQLTTWAAWVAFAPACARFGESVSLRLGVWSWRSWAAHAIGVATLLALHAPWTIALSMLVSPYPSSMGAAGATAYFLRFAAAIDVALYAALVASAASSVAATPAISALREGMLDARRALAVAGGPAIAYDPDSAAILAVNQEAIDKFGWDANSFRQLAIDDLLDGEIPGAAPPRLARSDDLPLWRARMTLRAKDGARFEADTIGHAVNLDGAWARMLLVTDITEAERARQAQDALRESERRAISLRMQLSDAQLRALKLQLKPHFLFNILNTVSMMIRGREYAVAQRIVTTLGDMFRRFLEFEGLDSVPLEDEMDFVGLYLSLERCRFEDRMVVTTRIEPETLTMQVPTLLLQPVVENAVKHGVSRSVGRCEIVLCARREAGNLIIEVINDMGDGRDAPPPAGAGIGVANTRARLRELYGDRAAFSLSFDGGKAHASLTLPMEGNGT